MKISGYESSGGEGNSRKGCVVLKEAAESQQLSPFPHTFPPLLPLMLLEKQEKAIGSPIRSVFKKEKIRAC